MLSFGYFTSAICNMIIPRSLKMWCIKRFCNTHEDAYSFFMNLFAYLKKIYPIFFFQLSPYLSTTPYLDSELVNYIRIIVCQHVSLVYACACMFACLQCVYVRVQNIELCNRCAIKPHSFNQSKIFWFI